MRSVLAGVIMSLASATAVSGALDGDLAEMFDTACEGEVVVKSIGVPTSGMDVSLSVIDCLKPVKSRWTVYLRLRLDSSYKATVETTIYLAGKKIYAEHYPVTSDRDFMRPVWVLNAALGQ